MSDDFESHSATLTSPGDDGVAVVPSDTQDLPHIPRAIYVGGAGHVTGLTKNDVQITFHNVPAGGVLPFRFKRILTSSTATLMTAFW